MITASGNFRTVKEVGKAPVFTVEIFMYLGDMDDSKTIVMGVNTEAELLDLWQVLDLVKAAGCETAEIATVPGFGRWFDIYGYNTNNPEGTWWPTDNYESSVAFEIERVTVTTAINGIQYEIERA